MKKETVLHKIRTLLPAKAKQWVSSTFWFHILLGLGIFVVMLLVQFILDVLFNVRIILS